MATPLISVVIPTANRPQYLPRAIESALAGMTPGEVEVIVVPNGLDESWRSVAENYRHHLSVIWLPTQIAHANVARNIGLVQARGKFIRFLDDDDFIYPTAASEQIDLLEKTGDELCSGLVMNLDDHSEQLGTLGFPDTKDFVCAALSVSGFTLPVGNVFLRNTLRAARWDESVNRAQDYVWMVQLAAIKEWKWVHLEKHVGVWFQHPGQRVSTVSTASDRPNNIIDAITGLHRRLSEQSRLTAERADALAEALWHYIHRFFPYAPRYWARVAEQAYDISPRAGPRHPVFDNAVLRSMDPLQVEWLMLPLRLISTNARKLRHAFFAIDYRRRL